MVDETENKFNEDGVALQRAKQSLEDEFIRLDATKKHEASLLGGTEDAFGQNTFCNRARKSLARAVQKASTTSSAPTLEATGVTISIFDDMLQLPKIDGKIESWTHLLIASYRRPLGSREATERQRREKQ